MHYARVPNTKCAFLCMKSYVGVGRKSLSWPSRGCRSWATPLERRGCLATTYEAFMLQECWAFVRPLLIELEAKRTFSKTKTAPWLERILGHNNVGIDMWPFFRTANHGSCKHAGLRGTKWWSALISHNFFHPKWRTIPGHNLRPWKIDLNVGIIMWPSFRTPSYLWLVQACRTPWD